jgi:hypothetical protein
MQGLVSCPSLAALALRSEAFTLAPLKAFVEREDDDGEAAMMMRDVLQFDLGQHDPHEALMMMLDGQEEVRALMRMELTSRVRTMTRAEAPSSVPKRLTTPL